MLMFNRNVFCSQQIFRFYNGNTTLVILEDFKKNFWIWKMNIENK